MNFLKKHQIVKWVSQMLIEYFSPLNLNSFGLKPINNLKLIIIMIAYITHNSMLYVYTNVLLSRVFYIFVFLKTFIFGHFFSYSLWSTLIIFWVFQILYDLTTYTLLPKKILLYDQELSNNDELSYSLVKGFLSITYSLLLINIIHHWWLILVIEVIIAVETAPAFFNWWTELLIELNIIYFFALSLYFIWYHIRLKKVKPNKKNNSVNGISKINKRSFSSSSLRAGDNIPDPSEFKKVTIKELKKIPSKGPKLLTGFFLAGVFSCKTYLKFKYGVDIPVDSITEPSVIESINSTTYNTTNWYKSMLSGAGLTTSYVSFKIYLGSLQGKTKISETKVKKLPPLPPKH